MFQLTTFISCSYDNVVHTRHYCFTSPLYSNVWSPPTCGRRSASQTPLFGSIRRVESNDQVGYPRKVIREFSIRQFLKKIHFIFQPLFIFFQDVGTTHVYLTPRHLSPLCSVRESDLDTNTSSPEQRSEHEHVYAFQ